MNNIFSSPFDESSYLLITFPRKSSKYVVRSYQYRRTTLYMTGKILYTFKLIYILITLFEKLSYDKPKSFP